MKFEYDVPIVRKQEDATKLVEFMESDKSNMCITYDNVQQARRRRFCLKKIVDNSVYWKSITIKQRDEKLYVIREDNNNERR